MLSGDDTSFLEKGLPLNLNIFQQDPMNLEVLGNFITTDNFDLTRNLQNIPTLLTTGFLPFSNKQNFPRLNYSPSGECL